MTLYRVDDRTRTRLKHPYGQLIVGGTEKTMPILAKMIAKEVPAKVVVVGDAVSLGMRKYGMEASLYIVDQKTLRTDISDKISGLNELVVRNPAGEVTEEAYEMLKRVLREEKSTVIRVEGEEDLLTLPLILLAPIGSIIAYGQPHVGLVVIRVTPALRNEARLLLDAMKISKSGKG
ncbi:DUF359 domain-containing protein [Candidatus Bathyarchaeota archaeon]|nr:DUF359 domain-containing protein [Candidatus Bathyarchaeota archaeon]